MNRQVIDIRTSAGVGDISNEILRRWSDKGYDQAVKEGNYDRSRERLNFEIAKGGKVVPVDKERPLDKRMAEMLASRGIKDPNIGRENPNIRTAVQFIFSGSHDRMTELAFGNQKVDFEAKSGNENVKRMPEIEEWAKDIYNFVARKFGEENIISFVVHLDETTAHAHCDIVPVNEKGRISYKDVFHGHNKAEYKQFILQLHNELAEVNSKWGLARGTSKVLTGAKGHTTESYRRWLNQECDSLEERRSNLQNAIRYRIWRTARLSWKKNWQKRRPSCLPLSRRLTIFVRTKRLWNRRLQNWLQRHRHLNKTGRTARELS